MKYSRTLHHFILAVTALLFFLPSLSYSHNENMIAMSLIVIIGTFFIYRLSVWVPFLSNHKPYFGFHTSPNILEFLLYFLILLFCSLFISVSTTILFLSWGTISLLYFMNFKINRFEFKGLRSIPIVKPILLAFMWTIIGFMFNLKSSISIITFSPLLLSRFFIILFICLGVDLRDIEKDKDAQTTTLATYFGFNKLRTFMILCNVTLILFQINVIPDYPLDLFISCLVLMILFILKINYSRTTFTILLDGTLFLYSFLNFIASYIRFC